MSKLLAPFLKILTPNITHLFKLPNWTNCQRWQFKEGILYTTYLNKYSKNPGNWNWKPWKSIFLECKDLGHSQEGRQLVD